MPTAQEIIKKVKHIEITTKHLVDSLIAGNFRSVFRGQGVEFSELREYVPGDDIRSIDWNVTARYDHPYVKSFIEERDLRVYVVLDVSGSGNFGNTTAKKTRALEIVATLLFSAQRNQDACGLFLFTNQVEKYIPARKGRRHLFKLLSHLLTHEPQQTTTAIGASLRQVANVLKKRSVIFIVSDFFDTHFFKELSQLRQRHDVIAVRLIDRRELVIPPLGLIEMEDEETGEQITVDTSNPEFQAAYQERVGGALNVAQQVIVKSKADLLHVDTDTPFETPLRRFFAQRKAREVR